MKGNIPKPKEQEREIPSSGIIIRIASTDIPGEAKVYHGLTRIKGISWTISNLVCHKLNISRDRRINSLSEEEIAGIIKFLASSELPQFLVNRRNDTSSGQDKHIITNDLDMQRELDIRNMKKIRSYKG